MKKDWKVFDRRTIDYQSFMFKIDKTIDLILSDPLVRESIRADRVRKLAAVNREIAKFGRFPERLMARERYRETFRRKKLALRLAKAA